MFSWRGRAWQVHFGPIGLTERSELFKGGGTSLNEDSTALSSHCAALPRCLKQYARRNLSKKCQADDFRWVYIEFTEKDMESLNGYSERMLRVMMHIEQHLDEDISLADLADVACCSPYHFHRIFRGMVGESVMSYVRRLRLERAAQRLTYSDATVTGIALDAGYEAHESFIRAFRARFSESPSAYRTASRRRIHEEILRNASKGVRLMEVRIVTVPEKTVACVRHVGPYKDCGTAWEKLCTWGGPKGLLGMGTEFLGICYDDPEVTPADKIRYDACITVPQATLGDSDVTIREIGGGDYATAVHKGSYDNLIGAYGFVCGQWLPQSGREISSAPSIEIYRNNPEDTPEEELITEIYVPLESV